MASCLPESIETEVEQAESKMVVSSQILLNGIIVVALTRSFSALEGSFDGEITEEILDKILVKKARVVLSYHGKNDTLFQIGNQPGFYTGFIANLQDGDQMQLEIYDSVSNQTVVATSTQLPSVALNSISIKAKSNNSSIIDTTFILNYNFTDRPERNWYVLSLVNPNEIGNASNPFLGQASTNSYTELISDLAYNDPNISVETELPGYQMADTMVVMFTNISEDYFKYLDARRRGGGIISSLTGEPINHPTNVVGGYGFFNANRPQFMSVFVE
ncbi:MAG: DUF4249 family protein [Bacteroidetes bacterium]|nr:DUF4249 family protein [Bacteroidota bacterium]